MGLKLFPGITALYPEADTCTYQDGPNTNYGQSTVLYIGGYSSYYMRTYLKFDLSAFTGVTVSSAILKLYKHYINTNGANVTFSARRITVDWDENTLTYNNAPAYSAAYGPIYTFGDIDSWSEIDLTVMVQEWIDGTYPNYGVCLTYEATGYRVNSQWRSNQYIDIAYRPFIDMTPGIDPETSGTAIYGPYDLSTALNYYESSIEWLATVPEGSSVVVKTCVKDSLTAPASEEYHMAVSGEEIYGLSSAQSMSGWYLWIKVELSVSGLAESPEVLSLSWYVKDVADPKMLKIVLDEVNRMKHPQGNVIIEFNGTLVGDDAAFVLPFEEEFLPEDLVLWFNPNTANPTYLHQNDVDISITRTLIVRTFAQSEAENEYVGFDSSDFQVVRTNIDDIIE